MDHRYRHGRQAARGGIASVRVDQAVEAISGAGIAVDDIGPPDQYFNRQPGARIDDTAELPAAKRKVNRSGCVAAKAPSLSERQFV
jgi:hypothetical protein